MNYTLVLALALFAVVYSKETYSTENDNFDLDSIVNDPKKLKAFVNCFTEEGPCDELTNHFKKDLGEAIQQGCAKCTDTQKQKLYQFLQALKVKLPESDAALRAKFDPGNKYFSALETAVKPVSK